MRRSGRSSRSAIRVTWGVERGFSTRWISWHPVGATVLRRRGAQSPALGQREASAGCHENARAFSQRARRARRDGTTPPDDSNAPARARARRLAPAPTAPRLRDLQRHFVPLLRRRLLGPSPPMEQTPKGACDRGDCFMGRSAWLGRRRRRRIANGEGASFGRGRPWLWGATVLFLARWRVKPRAS